MTPGFLQSLMGGLKCLFFLATYCLLGLTKVYAQQPRVDLKEIKRTVVTWNDAHNQISESAFSDLYASSVLFYTRNLTKKECLERKLSILQNTKFSQELVGDLQLSVYEDGTIYCAFTKRVSRDGKAADYPSYLLIKESGPQYLITGEGDLITDRNLKFHLSLGSQIPRSKWNVISKNGTSDRISFSTNEVGDYLTVGLVLVSIASGLIGLIFIIKRAKKRPGRVQIGNNAATGEKRLYFEGSVYDSGPANVELEKGRIFEQFVIDRFRLNSVFKWTDATSDKGTRGYYPESNKNPDFQYEFRLGTYVHKFAIECKYRSRNIGLIRVLKDYQLERYKAFSRENGIDVYIFLGLGGNPGAPLELYLIPLDSVAPEMEHSDLSIYRTFRKGFYFDQFTKRLY